MTTLIKTEWLKIKKYNAFWWIMGITALSYPGINYIFYKGYEDLMNRPNQASEIAKVLLGNPFSFPEAWHTVAYGSSYFIFIPAVVVIMFVTNEYTYKTIRQNVIDGWSRSQFITSKLIDVLIISLLITLLYIAVSVVTGLTNQGKTSEAWSQSYYIGLFALQTFAQLSIAFLIGFLVKRAFIALGIFIGYYLIIENILVAVFTKYVNDIGAYLPFEMSDRMIPLPAFLGKFNPESYQLKLAAIPQHVVLTVIVTALIWLLCYRINNRRDL